MEEFEKIRLSRIANCLAVRGSTKFAKEYFNSNLFIKKYVKINK